MTHSCILYAPGLSGKSIALLFPEAGRNIGGCRSISAPGEREDDQSDGPWGSPPVCLASKISED